MNKSEHTAPLASANDLGELLGINPQTVRRWSREGKLPPNEHTQNGAALFDVAAARALHLEGAQTDSSELYARERALRMRIKRQIAEHDFADRSAQLVNAKGADALFRALQDFTRARVLAVPALVAKRIAAADDQHTVSLLLNQELRAALTMTVEDFPPEIHRLGLALSPGL